MGWQYIVDVEYMDGGKLRLFQNSNGTFTMNSSGEMSQDGCYKYKSAWALAHCFYHRPIKHFEIIQG